MISSFFAARKKRSASAAKNVFSPSTETEMSLSPDSSSSSSSNNKRSAEEGETQSTTTSSIKRVKTEDPVQEMLEFLDTSSNSDSSSSSQGWRQVLDKHFQSKKFETLAKFVSAQRKSATVYPAPCDVFSALTLTPMEKVKVVIVGQDPYHGPNQGHGLCFSVRKGVAIPPSLKNIYKELMNDPDVEFPETRPTHGYLERWTRQGVLLLNTVLTVRRGEANSHKKKGWEDVTDEILRTLARDRKQSGQGLVFLLWGKPAAKKIESVLGQGSKHRVIISTSHPSPLGATKTDKPFLGSKCFSRANAALEEMGLERVDWNVDGKELVDV